MDESDRVIACRMALYIVLVECGQTADDIIALECKIHLLVESVRETIGTTKHWFP